MKYYAWTLCAVGGALMGTQNPILGLGATIMCLGLMLAGQAKH